MRRKDEKKKKGFMKSGYIILIILILFLALRIPGLGQDVYGDEFYYYHFAYSDVDHAKSLGMDPGIFSSYYMPLIFYKWAYDIYPSAVSLRIVSLLFGLGTLLVGMKILESFFSRRASHIFGFLYAIIPWPVFTSVLMDNDGTVISFVFTLIIYITMIFLRQYRKNDAAKKRTVIILGLVSGLLIFLKFATFMSIILFNIMIIACIISWPGTGKEKRHKKGLADMIKEKWSVLRKGFKKKMHDCMRYSGLFIAGVISMIAFLLAIEFVFIGPESIDYLIIHYTSIPQTHFTFGGFSLTFIMEMALALLLISPIVILFLINLFHTGKDLYERYLTALTIFYIVQMMALVYAYNSASINRYAAFLLIPILLSVAILLSRFLDEKKFMIATASAAALSVIYFLIELLPHRMLDFYPKSAWISNIIHLRWDFLVPINGANGPMGFYMSFFTIALPFIICALCALPIIILIIKYRKNLQKAKGLIVLMMIMTIAALSYGFHMSAQFTYSPTSVSINSINHQMKAECTADKYYVFRNNAGFAVQRGQSYNDVKAVNFENENDKKFIDNMISTGEYVCVIDFPQISKTSMLWTELDNRCVLKKTYSDKGKTLGYWFDC